MKILSTVFYLALTTSAFAVDIPDPRLTPGEANPVLTKQVICAPGFTTRKYRHVTAQMKNKVYALYHVKNHQGYCSGPQGCEVDHLIALEDGGQNSVKNLWPQPFDGQWNAHMKDALETKIHKLICAGGDLAKLQHEIASDWKGAYKRYVK